jgi:pimeloyl-[acyl-carrier protein] methyl ester esterase
MLNREIQIYAIPGWGFQSSVFSTLSNENFHMIGLDYMHLTQPTLTEISTNLSTSIPEQSVLLGWSFGGLIAMQIAVLFPVKVKKLILLHSQPKLLESDHWMGINQIFAQNFKNEIEQDFTKSMNRFLRWVAHPNRSFATRQALKQHMFHNSMQALTSSLIQLFNADLRDKYRHLHCDIHHIISEQDGIIQQNPIHLVALNPRIRTKIFTNTSHAGFLSNRLLYIDAIKDFLYHE